MRADELDRLDEHAGGTATGIVDPASVGLQHLDQELDHAARGIELAALFALGAGELRQKVLVDPAEHVLGAGVLVADLDVADHVDELTKPYFIEGGAGVVLGQHILERLGVVALDSGHGIVDDLTDVGLLRLGLEMCPAGSRRHPENVLGHVFVAVLSGLFAPLGFQARMGFLEGVGDVFEEDQAENDVFVLGRVHAATQRVGHGPQLGLVAGCCTGFFRCLPRLAASLPWSCSGHIVCSD